MFYTKAGFIKSRSHKYDHDINSVLHLNGVIDNSGAFVRDTATQLVANRKKTYEACSRFLENKKKKYKNEEQFLNFIEKTIDKYENRAEYEEYLGVTLYFLKRRLRGRA